MNKRITNLIHICDDLKLKNINIPERYFFSKSLTYEKNKFFLDKYNLLILRGQSYDGYNKIIFSKNNIPLLAIKNGKVKNIISDYCSDFCCANDFQFQDTVFLNEIKNGILFCLDIQQRQYCEKFFGKLGMKYYIFEHFKSYFHLVDDFNSFLMRLPSNLHNILIRNGRKLLKQSLKITYLTTMSDREIFINDFLAIQKNSWQKNDEIEFLSQVVNIFLEKQIFASVLQIGSKKIAINIWLKKYNKEGNLPIWQLWKHCFDKEYKDFSPGSVLFINDLKNFSDFKPFIFDMGRGNKEFKSIWCHKFKQRYGIRIYKKFSGEYFFSLTRKYLHL